MNRSLDVLSPEFKTKVFELLARLVERGVAVLIVQTSRTLEEHINNVAAGTSKTSHSKHVPRGIRGVLFTGDPTGVDAIDLAPYDQYQLHGPDKLKWDTTDPVWKVIGEEAEKLDLRWGGRWWSPVDPGHVELILSDSDRRLASLERTRSVGV